MLGTPDSPTTVERLQAALRIAHRGRVRDLKIEWRAGGVELRGEAVSYYAIQLVLRDVLAAGVRRCRNRIRVPQPVTPPPTGDAR